MLKKLKSLFIVEDESSAKKPAANAGQQKATTPTQGKPAQSSKSQPTVSSKPDPGKGKADEKFINRLLGALEENNLKGFDYLEYKQSMQNLSGVEMDEATKFKSALAMAKTMGADSGSLLKSAQHYLAILDKEEQKFLQAFKGQQVKQVSSRNDQIAQLENSIKVKTAQIEKLKKEIALAEENLAKLKKSINAANVKVETTKNNFYHSYHIVRQQIADDIKKMQQYLG